MALDNWTYHGRGWRWSIRTNEKVPIRVLIKGSLHTFSLVGGVLPLREEFFEYLIQSDIA